MPDYRSPCCGLPLEPMDADGDLYCPCGLDHRAVNVIGHPNYDGAPSETDTVGPGGAELNQRAMEQARRIK